jgi:hypothetical protein
MSIMHDSQISLSNIVALASIVLLRSKVINAKCPSTGTCSLRVLQRLPSSWAPWCLMSSQEAQVVGSPDIQKIQVHQIALFHEVSLDSALETFVGEDS